MMIRCSTCKQTVTPQPLVLDAWARHLDMEERHGAFAEVRLYAWIGSQYTDEKERKAKLPVQSMGNFRGMVSFDAKPLKFYTGNVTKDVRLRASLKLHDHPNADWQHSEYNGGCLYPPTWELPLKEFFPCACNPDYQLMEWRLTSTETPGSVSCDVMQCIVIVDYVSGDGHTPQDSTRRVIDIAVTKMTEPRWEQAGSMLPLSSGCGSMDFLSLGARTYSVGYDDYDVWQLNSSCPALPTSYNGRGGSSRLPNCLIPPHIPPHHHGPHRRYSRQGWHSGSSCSLDEENSRQFRRKPKERGKDTLDCNTSSCEQTRFTENKSPPSSSSAQSLNVQIQTLNNLTVSMSSIDTSAPPDTNLQTEKHLTRTAHSGQTRDAEQALGDASETSRGHLSTHSTTRATEPSYGVQMTSATESASREGRVHFSKTATVQDEGVSMERRQREAEACGPATGQRGRSLMTATGQSRGHSFGTSGQSGASAQPQIHQDSSMEVKLQAPVEVMDHGRSMQFQGHQSDRCSSRKAATSRRNLKSRIPVSNRSIGLSPWVDDFVYTKDRPVVFVRKYGTLESKEGRDSENRGREDSGSLEKS